MRVVLTVFGLLLIGAAGASAGGDEPKAAPPPAVSEGREGDAKAIRDADAAFVRAYNAGDAKAIAELLADDAEAVDDDGDTIRGRKAIADAFAAIFADSPGAKIEVTTDSLRFLGADVALETGRTKVTPADAGSPDLGRFTILFVKHEGRWLQSYVREDDETELTPRDHLKELEWLVGTWVTEGDDAVVLTTCRWSDDKNFLLRDFSIQTQGKPVLSGTQRIGWDPQSEQFKSWVFDSEGGFGEGQWTRGENQWIIKSSGVRQDGRKVSSTQVLTFVNPHTARWTSIDRTVGDKAVPDFDEIVMVKRAPKPR